jgi:hypothetical protein
MVGHTVRNIVAAALALLALLLAAITVSAIISGVDGLLVIVVGATGCGAVLLGLIAAWLRSSSGPDYEPVLSSVRSRHRTGHKFRARAATREADPMPVPPPVMPIRPAAQPVVPEAGPRVAAHAPTPQKLPSATTSRTVPRPRDRNTPACDYTPPARVARTPGGRRFILGVGLLVLFTGVQDLRTGNAQLSARSREGANRVKEPFTYWTVVALKLGFAGALLSVVARDALLARRQRRSGG